MNQCPKCNTSVDDNAKECPQCGIFFSKWKEREENISSGNLSRYAAVANATSAGFNWTILIIVVVAVGLVFYFLGQQAKEL